MLWPPAQEQLISKCVVLLTDIGVARLSAPKLWGLRGDSLREELPQLACFSVLREERYAVPEKRLENGFVDVDVRAGDTRKRR